MLFILKERKGHHKEADQAANLGLGVGTVPSTQAHKVTRIKMSQYVSGGHRVIQPGNIATSDQPCAHLASRRQRERACSLQRPRTPRGLLATRRGNMPTTCSPGDHPEPSCPVALTKLRDQMRRLGRDHWRTGRRRRRLQGPLRKSRQEGGWNLFRLWLGPG